MTLEKKNDFRYKPDYLQASINKSWIKDTHVKLYARECAHFLLALFVYMCVRSRF
jgi:hypothetical protein